MSERSPNFKTIDYGNEQSQDEIEKKRILDAQKQIQERRDDLMVDRQYLECLVKRLKDKDKCIKKKKLFEPMHSKNTCSKPPLLEHVQPIQSNPMLCVSTSFDESYHTQTKPPEEDIDILCNEMDQNLDLYIPNTGISVPIEGWANCSMESLEEDKERLINELGKLVGRRFPHE